MSLPGVSAHSAERRRRLTLLELIERGEIRLYDGAVEDGFAIRLRAPATLAADVDLVLPSADGSAGQVLQTDGAGGLSFVPGGGTQAPSALDVSGAITVDLSTNRTFYEALGDNATYTFSNPVDGAVYRFIVKQVGGSKTITWPAAVKWVGGSAYVVSTTANKIDLVTLVYSATLAIYMGSAQKDYS